jgi:hypothetical protein
LPKEEAFRLAPLPGIQESHDESFVQFGKDLSGKRRRMSSRMAATLQRKCACGKGASGGEQCEDCKKKALQRHAISNWGPAIAPPIVHDVLRSPGQPLDKATRGLMEPRFGRDFSDVRVHTDDKAAESARAVNALAYTVGRKIVFGTGLYQPKDPSGMRLLTHELTHVVQQRDEPAPGRLLRLGSSTDFYEREAERVAAATMEMKTFNSIEQSTSGVVQRQGDAAPPAAPPARPVFFCSKPVALGFSHAFFRVGGSGPGNSTFELEHDENGEHCPCGIQGWPTRDYPEDRDSSDAQCVPAPAVSESCLVANWNSYPIGKYCALGPNSNSYGRFLAESCGARGLRPPGRLPGFSDGPPPANTANPALDARVTILPGGCTTIQCDDTFCRQAPPF